MNFDIIMDIFLIFCLAASVYTMWTQQKTIKGLHKENLSLKKSAEWIMTNAVELARKVNKHGL